VDTPKKKIFLIRHGETAWTISGQHTGSTDIPLTQKGIEDTKKLGTFLQAQNFAAVFVSPLGRSIETCQHVGLMKKAQVDEDLKEWNYGKYEGLTSKEITETNPTWTIFTEGAPEGESLLDIKTRADRFLKKIEKIEGDIAVFSHGHFSRALGVSWLGLPLSDGRLFALFPASISILGYEKDTKALLLWNQT